MKNLIVSILVLATLMLQNCTPEDTLTVGLAVLSAGGDSNEIPGASATSEWNALDKNWTNNSCTNFNAPTEYGDNILFYDSKFRSINKYTGIENWNLDIGYISYSATIHPITVDDKLYFIYDNDIFIVGLDTGELLLKHEWEYPETIKDQFSIQDGIMYVNVKEFTDKYSAFASCSLTDLDAGQWTYLNRIESNNVFMDIVSFKVDVNSLGQHVIYFRSEILDLMNHGISSDNSEVRAYNTATRVMSWIYRGPTISFFEDEFFLTDKNQLIVNGQEFMHCINTQTGQKIWEIPTGRYSNSFSQPQRIIQYQDMVIFINGAEIATAYNINSGSKVWELNNTSFSFEEKGVTSSSINLRGDKLFYLSDWGLLMEIDLEAGMYIRHHDSLVFSGGLVVDEDENFIAFPKYQSGSLMSFSL